MTVFVKDSNAAFCHNAAKFSDQQRLVIDKGDDPAAPREIVVALRDFTFHQIQFVDLYIRERARAAGSFHRANEVLRTLERYHFTGGPNDLSKIDGGVAGTGSDIQHAFTNRDAGTSPAIQNNRPPDAMLKAEPG